jgi:hypothetical protein
MAAGLIKGEGFAVDASVMEANASRYHGKAPEELDWTDAQRQKRAVAEYLAGLAAEAHAQEDGASDGGGSDGTRSTAPDRKPPKVISPSDPSSAWTAKANKRVQFGYGLNYFIDLEHAIIVDVEPTPARTYDEVESTKATHSVICRTNSSLSLAAAMKSRAISSSRACGFSSAMRCHNSSGVASSAMMMLSSQITRQQFDSSRPEPLQRLEKASPADRRVDQITQIWSTT